jgi:hypothetical protein
MDNNENKPELVSVNIRWIVWITIFNSNYFLSIPIILFFCYNVIRINRGWNNG